MEQRYFVQASLEYVLKLQEVHERKKFEFVETVRIVVICQFTDVITYSFVDFKFYVWLVNFLSSRFVQEVLLL